MDTGIAAVLGALIAAVGAIIVKLIDQFRKENHEDHDRVRQALDRVSTTMDRVEGKVDSHIEWHLTGGSTSGRTIRRNKSGTRKAS
jgi:hypothetical protein